MKNLFLTPLALLLLTLPATAMTEEECTNLWKQADANGDGTLNGVEADRYLAMMRMSNKTMTADGTMTEKLFQENCKTDIFTPAAIDAGAPLEGANSFTEAQAKDRILAMGLSGVSALTKDDKGVWRGSAQKEGKSVDVAVDYKGNVVTQ